MAAPTSPQSKLPDDPVTGSRFFLEIGGITEAEFHECSGLSNETDVVTQAEGGENTFAYKFRGRSKYPNLVLKHGVSKMSPSLWAWREAVIHRKTPPILNMSVVMTDMQGQEILRWSLTNCWPCKWQGPDLKAGESALAIETLEVAYDYFQVKPGTRSNASW